MGNFIIGVLRDNRRGAADDADHVLYFEDASGHWLNIFCPPPLCEDLMPGQTYELIIRGTAFASPEVAPDDCLRYYDMRPDGDYYGWEGEVIGIGHRFVPDPAIPAREALYRGGWLVVATPIGQIIVRSRVLRPPGIEMRAGGIVRFNGCRFDLYGVVSSGDIRSSGMTPMHTASPGQ